MPLISKLTVYHFQIKCLSEKDQCKGKIYSLFTRLLFGLILLASINHCIFGQSSGTIIERTSKKYGSPNGFVKDITEDSYGYLWVGSREGVFRYDGYVFKAYRHDIFDEESLSHPNVNSIFEDSAKKLWITSSDGLSLFDRTTEKFQRFYPFHSNNDITAIIEPTPGKLLLANKTRLVLYVESDGTFINIPVISSHGGSYYFRNFIEYEERIWISTNRGLLIYDPLDRSCYPISEGAFSEIKSNITGLTFRENGNAYLSTDKHLFYYQKQDDILEEIKLPESLIDSRIDHFFFDNKNNIWLAFDYQGLLKINTIDLTFQHFTHNPENTNSLNSNSVTSIYQDRFSNYWIGTFNGLCKIKNENPGFYSIKNNYADGSLTNNVVRLVQDGKGTIYTKTYDGFYQKDKDKEEAVKIRELAGAQSGLGWDWFIKDKEGGIWLTISQDGLYRKGPYDGLFKKMDYGDTLSRVGFFKIQADRSDDQVIWLGTTLGLCRLNWKTGERKWYYPKNDIPEVRSNRVAIFEQYGNDQIWLYYTYSLSIGYFDKKQGKFHLAPTPDEDKKLLKGHIKDIAITREGNLYLASLFGLTNFNIPEETYRIYGKNHGLEQNELQSVMVDKNDDVWVSGHRFIARYDKSKDSWENFRDNERMYSFQTKSRHLTEEGKILFGSAIGIYAIDPNNLNQTTSMPDIVLTGFKVNNNTHYLPQPFEATKFIELEHQENDITFEFSGLHFTNPNANTYKCILEGYEKEWRELGREHKVRYAKLNHGKYKFKVSAANRDGIWKEEGMVIDLHVNPAFWQTTWFKGLVLLVILLFGYGIIRLRQKQYLLKRDKEIAEKSAAYKTQFLADVSHEIRTPMNAIIGLSKLTMDTPLDTKQTKFVSAIKESSEQLLTIINDLLDHTKLASGKFTFTEKPFDLRRVIKTLNNTLTPLAEEKSLKFLIDIDSNIPSKIVGDPVRLNQIMTNLVGNALKFTEQGKVWLNISQVGETENDLDLRFEIGDTGIGIPKDKLEFIFGSWNQSEAGINKGMEGTGLGLTIANQLVEHQNGKMTLQSKEGEGTLITFTISFAKASTGSLKSPLVKSNYQMRNLNILVVEDTYFNQMLVVEFLQKNIEEVKIEIAENGLIALEKLKSKSYDIVLMDVKMPEMDGFEATKIIRKLEDTETREIPIIAVTASAVQDQLDKCKEAGMNDYITKPIDENVLLHKIYLHTHHLQSL